MESAGFYTSRSWLEKHFQATETLGAINDDVFVWELEGLEGPYRVHTLGWSNHLDLIVDEANAVTVSSFVMCSRILWNMVVSPGNMT